MNVLLNEPYLSFSLFEYVISLFCLGRMLERNHLIGLGCVLFVFVFDGLVGDAFDAVVEAILDKDLSFVLEKGETLG